MEVNNLNAVKTGDLLFFTSNTVTGFILKVFTSSEWNHAGIAIRMLDKNVVSEGGELYVLEINSGLRKEKISDDEHRGLGLSEYSYVKGKYNRIVYRSLKEEYRKYILDKSLEFINKYHGSSFSTGFLPFIGAWLGLPLVTENRSNQEGTQKEFFCSELVILYYSFCLNKEVQDIFVCSPKQSCLYTPKILSENSSNIFDNNTRTIHYYPCSTVTTLVQPLIITFFILTILAMLIK